MARFQSATEQKLRSREVTKAVMARELCYAGVMARFAVRQTTPGWSAYLTEPKNIKQNPGFPALLCIDTPAGLAVWRLSLDELDAFKEWLPYKENDGRVAEDKAVLLYALAFDGWE
jgi:hypothetical protein